MFLTSAELAELTGYKLPAHQRRWLTAHGWSYATNANGRPVVSRSHAEARLAGAGVADQAPAWAPNLEALRAKA